jgi:hypothetical protein
MGSEESRSQPFAAASTSPSSMFQSLWAARSFCGPDCRYGGHLDLARQVLHVLRRCVGSLFGQRLLHVGHERRTLEEPAHHVEHLLMAQLLAVSSFLLLPQWTRPGRQPREQTLCLAERYAIRRNS